MNKINKKRFRGSTSTKWFFVYPIFGRIDIWKCWFLRRGENRRKNALGALIEGENQQQTQQKSINCSRMGFERRPHWWEASALITTPPLLYVSNFHSHSLRLLSPLFIVAFCFSKFHFNNCPLWFTDKFCKVKTLIQRN